MKVVGTVKIELCLKRISENPYHYIDKDLRLRLDYP